MTWFLLIVQFLTLVWVWKLDQDYKLLDRYVQGLRVPLAPDSESEHPMSKEPGRFA